MVVCGLAVLHLDCALISSALWIGHSSSEPTLWWNLFSVLLYVLLSIVHYICVVFFLIVIFFFICNFFSGIRISTKNPNSLLTTYIIFVHNFKMSTNTIILYFILLQKMFIWYNFSCFKKSAIICLHWFCLLRAYYQQIFHN